jgi:proline dehydrogenase
MWYSRHLTALGLKEWVVLPLAKKWIAGVALDSAVREAEKANSMGMGVVVNFLGEEIKDPAMADAAASEYLRLQQALHDNNVNGYVSVKLTQLGLGADDEGMRARLEKIADNAVRLSQLLWIDMEGSAQLEKTIAAYLDVHRRHPGVGVALQSYTRRSESDLKAILDAGGRVRLVKGAYRESPDVVYTTRAEVNRSFERLMVTLFERGNGFAIATHDGTLVRRARELAEKSSAEFHFELLKGIRDELKEELTKAGYKVYTYLPYGDRWWAYSKRRITEHPSNIWLLLRSLV